jgi:hypothetical protein
MRTSATSIAIAFAVGVCFAPLGARAYNSGSTGADGEFNPTVSTTVPLPPSGIFNFTTVTIPANVTVTFARNTINTPVVILASGNVSIAGTISVSGGHSAATGAGGDGAQGDDGTPGLGGPGGFDGGRGGRTGALGVAATFGGAGLGPGAGTQGTTGAGQLAYGGGGGGFGAGGGNNRAYDYGFTSVHGNSAGLGGGIYGAPQLLPLIGGSGGGGGGGGSTYEGSGGGGGGGAILIASSGTVSVTGQILANGGSAGVPSGGQNVAGGGGGGGAGGAIRILATVIAGNGLISAGGGARGEHVQSDQQRGGNGGVGRIRLEADTMSRNAVSTPSHTGGDVPGAVFIAGTPTLRIARVAGVNAPASPTGNADVTLPASTPSSVLVEFETTGVPVGNTVQVTVTPAYGARSSAITPALTGSTTSATASVNVTLPAGPSVLSAQTTYTVVAAVGDLLKNFAGNERVEKVTLLASLGGQPRAKLTTVSGKEYEVPADVLRIAALGG